MYGCTSLDQISVTQQLEMRQLSSAMNRDANVQIVVTEPSVRVEVEPATATGAHSLAVRAKTKKTIRTTGQVTIYI